MCQIFDSIYVIYSMKNIWCLIIEIGLSNIKKDLVFDLKEGHSMPKLYIYVYLTMKMDPDLYFFSSLVILCICLSKLLLYQRFKKLITLFT